MKKLLLLTITIFYINAHIKAQIELSVETKLNTVCTGSGCEYNGPKILINEVMLSPAGDYDGSIYGKQGGTTQAMQGEWIELYNPEKCKSVDISCYYLGNNAPDRPTTSSTLTDYGAGLTLPQGTIVPPRGFVIIRGINAPAVPSNLLVKNGGNTIEIVVDDAFATQHVCLGNGYRLWFPNAGGWFAFYDNNGAVQDAISWNSTSNFCSTCTPCNPGNCSYSGAISAFSSIPSSKKNYITSLDPKAYSGSSFHRNPDGGSWVATPGTPTYGTCNGTCIPEPIITCTGEATVTATGGTTPYKYIWDDAKETKTATVTGLCAGIYHVTVTDGNNNTAVKTVEIKNIEIEASLTTTNVELKCYGDKNGNITANASNGTSPYTYTWSNGSSGATVNNLAKGNYNVVITDKNGCTKTLTATVTQPDEIKLTSKADSVKCNGQSTGSINIETTGGISPYTYLWNTEPAQTESKAVNLAAGFYSVTVTDKNGCTKTITEEIQQPSELTLSLTPTDEGCENSCTGIVSTDAGGGVEPYIFKWNNDQSSEDINNLCAGTYILTITDHNGCTRTETATVGTAVSINASFTASPVKGYSPLKVAFTYTGTETDSYQWDFGDGTAYTKKDTSHTFTKPGKYSVKLIINSGTPYNCVDSFTVIIDIQDLSYIKKVSDILTVNGDDKNHEFKVDSANIGTFNCIIFNRWGKKIYEWNIGEEAWDGSTKGGKMASEGVYYYIIKATGRDEIDYKLHGSVTLVK